MRRKAICSWGEALHTRKHRGKWKMGGVINDFPGALVLGSTNEMTLIAHAILNESDFRSDYCAVNAKSDLGSEVHFWSPKESTTLVSVPRRWAKGWARCWLSFREETENARFRRIA